MSTIIKRIIQFSHDYAKPLPQNSPHGVIVAAIVLAVSLSAMFFLLRKSKTEKNFSSANSTKTNSLPSESNKSVWSTAPSRLDEVGTDSKLASTAAHSEEGEEQEQEQEDADAQIDVELFLTRLRQTGFYVEKIKGKTVKEKKLRLNESGELFWSSSWLRKKKCLALADLMHAIEGTDEPPSFILEFRGNRFLHLRIPSYEFPFDSVSMIQYFEALASVMAADRSYLTNFLRKCPAVSKDGARAPGGKNRKAADDHDDSRSVASDMSSSTSSTFSPPLDSPIIRARSSRISFQP